MNLIIKFKNSKNIREIIFRIALALTIGLGIHFFTDFSRLKYVTYDWRVKLNPIHKKSNHIKNLVINKNDIAQFNGEPTAKEFHSILKEVLKQSPSHVVFIFDPSKIKGSASERKKLAKTLEKKNIYFALNNLPTKDTRIKRSSPFDRLKVIMGPRTSDTLTFAKDNVTRRAILSYLDNLSIHSLIAEDINPQFNPRNLKGAYKFYRTKQFLINFLPTGSYQPVSLTQVKTISKDTFKEKIIFIGKETLEGDQYISTPYSRAPTAMSNLELHANIMDTLLLNKAPTLSHDALDIFIIISLSLIVVFTIMRLKPIRGLQVMIATLVCFIGISYLLYVMLGLVIAILKPLLAIFICYYLFIPYRLIIENRRNWEYQQKNKLLTQVEELKSNFLRMMSHDLKTPLARIQGMTEIILLGNNLSSSQEDAVKRIHQSTNELIEFIKSILNLNRIESKDIKLQTSSHDINDILQSVITSCEHLANQKNIKIEFKTEPLFSIKVDQDLIKQVFTNLIENAIKYSTENSTVKISSSEDEAGYVVITISDKGIGIDEKDLNHVFDKFFRSAQAENLAIKGSGIGLYLSKYFINLHKGHLYVESEPNKGSTFTAKLPM